MRMPCEGKQPRSNTVSTLARFRPDGSVGPRSFNLLRFDRSRGIDETIPYLPKADSPRAVSRMPRQGLTA